MFSFEFLSNLVFIAIIGVYAVLITAICLLYRISKNEDEEEKEREGKEKNG